jgi:hypothetical protein
MIVETWLNVSDPVVIEELTLPGYSFLSAPRGRSTYGGGIGALFKTELNLQTVDIDMSFPTFEFSCFSNISKVHCRLQTSSIKSKRPENFRISHRV